LKLSRPGSLIIVDNVVREGEIIDPQSSEPSIEGVRRFLEMVAHERRVTGTALQTVGVKGYDGFAILRVRS
jgi:predicted O-methyltransferase YrrM